MIFNDEMIFIHNGKTGGTSCSNYLLKNLKRPVYNCNNDNPKAYKAELGDIIHQKGIARHCTLSEALTFINQLNGKQLKDFKKVVVVIRHPYTLEFSFYNHLKKKDIIKRRQEKSGKLLQLASGNFNDFIEKAGFHRPNHPQEAYFLVDNKIPANVELVRFEQLSTDFPKAVAEFISNDASPEFPHANRTDYNLSLNAALTEEIRELIYQKHKFMFDSGLYARSLPASL